jgi:hypothetical protein
MYSPPPAEKVESDKGKEDGLYKCHSYTDPHLNEHLVRLRGEASKGSAIEFTQVEYFGGRTE